MICYGHELYITLYGSCLKVSRYVSHSPAVMYKILSPLVVFLALVVSSFAQEAISVDKVDFKSLKDDWIQMEVRLKCGENQSPDARDRNYVQGIKVKVYLAYIRDAATRRYDYYTSEAEIVIMERGDDNNVYFYLPGLIAKRDKLQPADPEFYYVEVSVGGEVQPPKGGSPAISKSIKNLDILNSFISKADSEGSENENILMPVYYVPAEYMGRVDKLPTFLRRDVRE